MAVRAARLRRPVRILSSALSSAAKTLYHLIIEAVLRWHYFGGMPEAALGKRKYRLGRPAVIISNVIRDQHFRGQPCCGGMRKLGYSDAR